MELNVLERLVLRNILPQIQGWNFGHLKEARQIAEQSFTPEEEESLQITVSEDGRQVRWRMTDDNGEDIPQTKELEISEGLTKKVREFLARLDKAEQLNWDHETLCQKFGLNGGEHDSSIRERV